MFALSETAREQLTETVRRFQELHAEELPKCDDAFRRLYPDQITLFAFRETWNAVRREREKAAAEGAKLAALRQELLAELQPAEPSTAETLSRGEDAEDVPVSN